MHRRTFWGRVLERTSWNPDGAFKAEPLGLFEIAAIRFQALGLASFPRPPGHPGERHVCEKLCIPRGGGAPPPPNTSTVLALRTFQALAAAHNFEKEFHRIPMELLFKVVSGCECLEGA